MSFAITGLSSSCISLFCASARYWFMSAVSRALKSHFLCVSFPSDSIPDMWPCMIFGFALAACRELDAATCCPLSRDSDSFPMLTIITLICCLDSAWAMSREATHCLVTYSSRYGSACIRTTWAVAIGTLVRAYFSSVNVLLTHTLRAARLVEAINCCSIGIGTRFCRHLSTPLMIGIVVSSVNPKVQSRWWIASTWELQKLFPKIIAAPRRSSTFNVTFVGVRLPTLATKFIVPPITMTLLFSSRTLLLLSIRRPI